MSSAAVTGTERSPQASGSAAGMAADMTGGMTPWARLGLTFALALAYGAVGWLALMLAGPPGYATPLFPSAGIALAAALTWGVAALPGVLLGSLAINVGLGLLQGNSGLALVTLPLIIASGATLQAAVGRWLVARFVGLPLALQQAGEIGRAGLFGAALACITSASVGTFALALAGVVPAEQWLSNWATWWVGDVLGVLIGTPLVLTLVGRPEADWRPRRLPLGLPLLGALALLAAASVEVERRDQERERLSFERRVERLVTAIDGRLRTPVFALQALHGAVRARGEADDAALAAAGAWWLAGELPLRAIGHSAWVPRAELPAFEQAARAAGLADYRVFQRDDGGALQRDGGAVVIRRILPLADNRGALGVNTLSIPAAREGVLAARDRGTPSASAPFRLTQAVGNEVGLVLYQALYDERGGPPQTEAARRDAFRGVLFVTVSLAPLLADLDAAIALRAGALRWCLRDQASGAPVAGAGCAARSTAATTAAATAAGDPDTLRAEVSSIVFGGRTLHLLAENGPRAADDGVAAANWLLSITGVVAAALLGALLLTVTGQARRTELVVQQRTGDLEREVAERQHAEAALRQSEARLRTILDNAPLGVAFLDPHGVLLEANQRLYEMLGDSAGALVGRSVDSVTHPDDRAQGLDEHRALLAGRIAVARRQMRMLRLDGSLLHARVTAGALRDEQGRVTRMVAVVEDIAERLRLEEAERAMHKAEAASRAKSEFVSRMSHELRTPLNAMLGFAQLLALDREPALGARQRGWADEIQHAGWHLLELINETLDLARIESGDVKLALQPVALPPLLAACRALVANAASQREVRLVDALPGELPAALADPTRLKQVLTNLLSNAVKYNRHGGEVRIDAAAAGGQVRIAVADTGLGMSDSQLHSLFQPYNRLGREDSGIEGTGIGLVISRRLVELMGGTLEVTSRPGAGTTFVLGLPAAPAPARPAEQDAVSTTGEYQRRSVLYVEDNETNVEIMRGMLVQRPQIALEVATLGLDGLAAARRLRPDLILLDMHLPDISGLELLRHLKQDEDAGAIPVVVVSADATPARIQQALTLGAARYITKPLDLARLLEAIDEVLDAAETRWGV